MENGPEVEIVEVMFAFVLFVKYIVLSAFLHSPYAYLLKAICSIPLYCF